MHHWEFLLKSVKDPRWTWRCILENEERTVVKESAKSFPTYRAAFDNALRNGMSPQNDKWFLATGKHTPSFLHRGE